MAHTPLKLEEDERKVVEREDGGGRRVKSYDEDKIGWVHPTIAHLLDSVVDRYRNSENDNCVETDV